MWENVIGSTITGGIIGVVVTIVFSILKLKFGYKKLYSEVVSKNRMDWINIWRESLATLIGCAENLHYAVGYDSNNLHTKPLIKNALTSKIVKCKKIKLLKNKFACFIISDKKGVRCNCDLTYIQYENDFYKARNAILLRLNMQEDLHRIMSKSLINFNYNEDNIKFEEQKEYIIELARAILKPEWERVKDEARGKEK